MVMHCLECARNCKGKKCQTWIDSGRPTIILNCYKFVQVKK